MIIAVKLFARARDLAAADIVRVELAEPASAADLRQAMRRSIPALAGLLDRSALAVNDQFVDDSASIPPNAEVALIPPVSGG